MKKEEKDRHLLMQILIEIRRGSTLRLILFSCC